MLVFCVGVIPGKTLRRIFYNRIKEHLRNLAITNLYSLLSPESVFYIDYIISCMFSLRTSIHIMEKINYKL